MITTYSWHIMICKQTNVPNGLKHWLIDLRNNVSSKIKSIQQVKVYSQIKPTQWTTNSIFQLCIMIPENTSYKKNVSTLFAYLCNLPCLYCWFFTSRSWHNYKLVDSHGDISRTNCDGTTDIGTSGNMIALFNLVRHVCFSCLDYAWLFPLQNSYIKRSVKLSVPLAHIFTDV